MKRWLFWVGVLISAVCLYWVLSKIDFALLWQYIVHANYWWILPGIAVYFVAVWVRAWRWHYLLRPLKSISTRTMFPIVAIGYMGNNIYPYRAGELLRDEIDPLGVRRLETLAGTARRDHLRDILVREGVLAPEELLA